MRELPAALKASPSAEVIGLIDVLWLDRGLGPITKRLRPSA